MEPVPGSHLASPREFHWCSVDAQPNSDNSRSMFRFVLAAKGLINCSPALADAFTERVGLSSERLHSLTSVLKDDVQKGRLPGAVLAVARRGQLAYFETVGYRDAATKAPMPRDAIFSIASMTKPMVSVAIMNQGPLHSPGSRRWLWVRLRLYGSDAHRHRCSRRHSRRVCMGRRRYLFLD